MSEKVFIFVCENHLPEVKAAAKTEQLDDVEVARLPVSCLYPMKTGTDEIIRTIREQAGSSDCICIFDYSLNVETGTELEKQCTLVRLSSCFELYTSPEVISDYLSKGFYLISSGMLSNWRKNMEKLRLKRDTAREMYSQSIKKLLWLDTGAGENAQEEMEAFSAFLDIPFNRVTVGLGYTRLFLSKIVLEWRNRKERKRNSEDLEYRERQIADFAMALDLIGEISVMSSETVVIENILKLFNAVCAPKALIYIPLADHKSGKPVFCPGSVRISEDFISRVVRMETEYIRTDSGDGFAIQIRRRNEPMGVIIMENFAFPQYSNYYLNFALSVNNVISLAVSNARAYEKLSEAREDLMVANEELEAFSYSVAHDLRTPLQVINGFGNLLKDEYAETLGGEGREYIHKILTSAERMFQLIDDLLRLARTGTGEISLTDTNLSETVNTILDSLIRKEPGRKAEFRVAENVRAMADAQLMMIVLENLLRNAWKFTEKNPETFIEFGEFVLEGKHVFFIRDNGAGFDIGRAGELFLPFKRLHSGKEYQGTGIGLTIVKRIIQRHGGKIWASGEPGKGATFYFTLR